jgi:hypothetical protein
MLRREQAHRMPPRRKKAFAAATADQQSVEQLHLVEITASASRIVGYDPQLDAGTGLLYEKFNQGVWNQIALEMTSI